MENEKVKKVFRSRISVLMLGFMLAVFIPCFIPIIKHMIISGLYIMGGTLVFVILLLTGMRYVIFDGKLYVKMWIIPNGSVKIADIASVKRSYNPLSSPAASLKRLCIGIKGKSINWLISPIREKEFVETLKDVNPDIRVDIPEIKGKWRIWDWDI